MASRIIKGPSARNAAKFGFGSLKGTNGVRRLRSVPDYVRDGAVLLSGSSIASADHYRT